MKILSPEKKVSHAITFFETKKRKITSQLYTTWKVERLGTGSTGWLFQRKIGPTWHISALLDFQEKLVSRVNCEEVEISSRIKYESILGRWIKSENDLGNWGKWRCYEVSHPLCRNYGRAQKPVNLFHYWRDEKWRKNETGEFKSSSYSLFFLTWISQFLSKNSLEVAATKNQVFEAL